VKNIILISVVMMVSSQVLAASGVKCFVSANGIGNKEIDGGSGSPNCTGVSVSTGKDSKPRGFRVCIAGSTAGKIKTTIYDNDKTVSHGSYSSALILAAVDSHLDDSTEYTLTAGDLSGADIVVKAQCSAVK